VAAQERQWDHDDKCVRRRAELTPRRRPCRRRAVQREPWECSRVAGAVRRRRHRTVGPMRSSTHERPQRRAETLPRLEHALEEITVAVEPVPHHLLGVARRIEALGDLVPVERRRDGRVRHRPDRIHRSPFADPGLRPVRLSRFERRTMRSPCRISLDTVRPVAPTPCRSPAVRSLSPTRAR
jgi:hypothetical protein